MIQCDRYIGPAVGGEYPWPIEDNRCALTLGHEGDHVRKAVRESAPDWETEYDKLLRWVQSMPDAGFSSDSPRWDWWHRRPKLSAPASQDAPGVMLTVAGKRFFCECGANVFSKVNGEYHCNGCPRKYESLDAPEADDD